MTCSCCSRTGVTPVNAAALNREPLRGSCHCVIIRCLFIISQGGNVSYYSATRYRTYMRGMRGLLTFRLLADRGGGGIRAESTRLGLLLTRRASLASGSPQAIWDDSVHWQHAIVCFSLKKKIKIKNTSNASVIPRLCSCTPVWFLFKGIFSLWHGSVICENSHPFGWIFGKLFFGSPL